MAVSLTPQQKYKRGLLSQRTSVGDTRIRYGYGAKPPKKPPKKNPYGLPTKPFDPLGGWTPGADFGQTQGFGGTLMDPGQAQQAYKNLIGGDWGVQGMESEMNARLGRARGDFTAQLRQALIDLGITDMSKIGGLGQYIDADTIKKAAENKYSASARIKQSEEQRQSQSEAALAARGMLSSGQTSKSAQDILAEGENQRYDALRAFLSGGQEGLVSIADLNDSLAMQLAQARFDAAGRAADMYGEMGGGMDPAELQEWAQQQQAAKGVKKPAAPRKPPRLTQQQKYRRGMLPTLTYTGSTYIKPRKPSKRK